MSIIHISAVKNNFILSINVPNCVQVHRTTRLTHARDVLGYGKKQKYIFLVTVSYQKVGVGTTFLSHEVILRSGVGCWVLHPPVAVIQGRPIYKPQTRRVGVGQIYKPQTTRAGIGTTVISCRSGALGRQSVSHGI